MDHSDSDLNRAASARDNPVDPTIKAHFTAEEAAAYMGLPIEMFRTLVSDGTLQPVRIMDTYHYRVADIQRYMAEMGMDPDHG
jgi:hypothetical protein